MEKSQVLKLVLSLILVEHIIMPLVISIWGPVDDVSEFTRSMSSMFSNFGVRLMLAIFVIRLVLWILPLFRIFTQVANKSWVKNIFFFALLNVMSNILMIGFCSMTWFPGLITLPITNITIVITFISPFILNSLPFSQRYVQLFMAQTS